MRYGISQICDIIHVWNTEQEYTQSNKPCLKDFIIYHLIHSSGALATSCPHSILLHYRSHSTSTSWCTAIKFTLIYDGFAYLHSIKQYL